MRGIVTWVCGNEIILQMRKTHSAHDQYHSTLNERSEVFSTAHVSQHYLTLNSLGEVFFTARADRVSGP